MRIETTHGLITGLTDPDEAASTDWSRWRDQLDVVKVVDPDRWWWPALHRAGFRVHPAWLTWVSPVGASEEAFLARVSRKERTTIRAAQRAAAERGIEFKVTRPITDAVFDLFLALYEHQVASMEHGVPFARIERDDILAKASDYLSVEAWVGGRLVGCCVCRIQRELSTVVIRFATSASDGRRHNVVRPMYMKVFETARQLGYDSISLGSDPALYGHIAKPGLFTFKSGLRFTPVPARRLGFIDDPDEATLVLRLDALTDPTLLVGYAVTPGVPLDEHIPLQLSVFTSTGVDLTRYQAPFLAGVNTLHIPRINDLATAS